MARAVEGVEEALRLRPPPTLVFNASNEGRDEAGAGECPREEAMDGRGEDLVDIMKREEKWTEQVAARRPDPTALSGGPCCFCGWSSEHFFSISSFFL
jgi:hypothetical protein